MARDRNTARNNRRDDGDGQLLRRNARQKPRLQRRNSSLDTDMPDISSTRSERFQRSWSTKRSGVSSNITPQPVFGGSKRCINISQTTQHHNKPFPVATKSLLGTQPRHRQSSLISRGSTFATCVSAALSAAESRAFCERCDRVNRQLRDVLHQLLQSSGAALALGRYAVEECTRVMALGRQAIEEWTYAAGVSPDDMECERSGPAGVVASEGFRRGGILCGNCCAGGEAAETREIESPGRQPLCGTLDPTGVPGSVLWGAHRALPAPVEPPHNPFLQTSNDFLLAGPQAGGMALAPADTGGSGSGSPWRGIRGEPALTQSRPNPFIQTLAGGGLPFDGERLPSLAPIPERPGAVFQGKQQHQQQQPDAARNPWAGYRDHVAQAATAYWDPYHHHHHQQQQQQQQQPGWDQHQADWPSIPQAPTPPTSDDMSTPHMLNHSDIFEERNFRLPGVGSVLEAARGCGGGGLGGGFLQPSVFRWGEEPQHEQQQQR